MGQTAERIGGSNREDNPVYQRHLVAYREAASRVTGDLLEIGCGEGYGIDYLASAANSYTGIDKYETAVFSKYKSDEKINLIRQNVPPLTDFKDASFDTVVSFQVIEHISDDERFLSEINRVLKPGGKALITTPNRKMSLSRNPWHIREYDVREMTALFEQHFDQATIYGIFGNKKMMDYHDKNRLSVRKIMRFDVLNLQYRLPRQVLQIPYDILNRLNRSRLKKAHDDLVSEITAEDFYLDKADDQCLDFFVEAIKKHG